MAPDVTTEEVARLARAMTWKFAACRVPYAGAKAGIRWNGTGDRAALIAAYRRALEPLGESFQTGPDLGTDPIDYVVDGDELPIWAKAHEGLGMDDLATGHGVKAAAGGCARAPRSAAGRAPRSRSRGSARSAPARRAPVRGQGRAWWASARCAGSRQTRAGWTSRS